MKAAIAVPYKRAAAHRLTAGQWEILSAARASPIPPILPGLDYRSVLRLRRELVVDVEGLRADCHLSAGAPLAASASWTSAGTMLRRSLARAPLPKRKGSCLVELSGEVSGADIDGSVQIETTIFLATRQDSGSRLAARQAGAVLLQERQTIQLDASHSFFPVELVDFTTGYWAHPEAGWRLTWNVFALEQPFLASVRLLVNAAHPRVAHAVSAEEPNAEASAVRAAIYFDVARSLVLGALGSEEFVEREGAYPEGSCGAVIYSMIQMLFPTDGISALAAAAGTRPDHFNTDLQGRLKLFGD